MEGAAPLWVEKYSQQHQRPYWVHRDTRQSTWTDPTHNAADAGGPGRAAAAGLRALSWFFGLFCFWGLCCAYAREAASAVLELSEKRSVQVFYRRQGLEVQPAPRRG